MKDIILELINAMKDEKFAQNLAYIIAMIVCAIVPIIFMLKVTL